MGATFQSGRRATARALDDLVGPFTTLAGSPGVFDVVGAQGLVNTTTGAAGSRYNGRYLYYLAQTATPGTATSQRVVRKDSYVPAAGTVGVDFTFGFVPVVNDILEMTALFPSIDAPFVAHTSYLELIRAASRRLNVRREITVPITTSQRLSLATWDDWITPERVLEVWEPSPLGRLMPAKRGWHVVEGSSPSLHLDAPFLAATGSLTIEVVSPAYSWVAISGVWQESTVGVTNESDELLVTTDELMQATLVEAYRDLAAQDRPRDHGSDAEDFEKQQAWCMANIADYDFGRPRRSTPAPEGVAA